MGSVRQIVMIGERFSRLVVVSAAYVKMFGKNQATPFRVVDCRCDCGTLRQGVRICHLKNGNSKSCGCLMREKATQNHLKHGLSGRTNRDPLAGVWSSMKTRCYNPKSASYDSYGGRGIKVCDEWKHDLGVFADWAAATGYIPRKLTIERIDVNGNYEPSNCKWIPASLQGRNLRRSRFVTAFGETKCIAAWIEDDRCKISYFALFKRISRGVSPELAITLPPNSGARLPVVQKGNGEA